MINQLRHHSSRLWRGFWDKLGIGLSGLCVIHCLLTPVLIATLPLWPEFLGMWEWAHPLFALVLIPTTGFAMRDAMRTAKRTSMPAGRRNPIIFFLASGLIVILSALLWHEAGDLIGETVVSTIGSALLITGHFLNYKAGKTCDLPKDKSN